MAADHDGYDVTGSSALHRFPHAGQKNTMIFGMMFSMTATRSLALRTHHASSFHRRLLHGARIVE
jgi:hypothetical protein